MNTSIRFIMSGLPRTIFAAAILAIALGVNDTLDLPSLLVRFTSAIVNFVMAGAILGSVLADADAMDMTDIAWIASMLVLSWIAIAAALTIYSRRVRRTFKPGTSGRRVGAAAWIIVVVLVVLNPIRGGGLMLPIVLFVLFCVTALLGTLMRRYQPVRSFVAMGFWIGLLLLPATGASILFADGETALSQRQLVHSRVGFVWIPFLLATMSFHISTSPSAKRSSGATSGLVLGISLLIVAGSGLIQGLFGRLALFNTTHVHVGFAIVAGAALGKHLLRYLKPEFAALGPSALVRLSRIEAASMLVVASLVLYPLTSTTPASSAIPATAAKHLETPLDPTWNSATPQLEAAVLSELDNPLGCGRSGGCHLDIQHQWSKSAHRFAANAAYRGTVEILMQEEGIEAARFCARCHDPAVLYSGRIRPGMPYPLSESEGVNCLACHTLAPEETEYGNGRFDLRIPAGAIERTANEISAYMAVRDRPDVHRADWSPQSLTDHSGCAACHTLTLGHVHLRRTFDEWSNARDSLSLPKRDATCTSCHMSITGTSILGSFQIHDHEFSGGNVALAGLRGRSVDAIAQEIASAIDVSARIDPIDGNLYEVTVDIANSGSGHDFPIGPRDLIRYWLEWREKREGSTWARLGKEDLFEERLFDGNGGALLNHEIWKVDSEVAAPRIPPGKSRTFKARIRVDVNDTTELEVRLMHERFRADFVRNVIGADHDLDTDIVEIQLVSVRK